MPNSLDEKIDLLTDQIGKLTEHTITTQNMLMQQGDRMDATLNRLETMLQQQGDRMNAALDRMDATLGRIEVLIQQQGQQQSSLIAIIQQLLTKDSN